MITGIVIAAVLVGGVGLFIGVFLGLAGKKFAVEVDEKEVAVREQFMEITVADVVTQDVMVLQRQLQKEKLRSMHVRSAEHRLQRK